MEARRCTVRSVPGACLDAVAWVPGCERTRTMLSEGGF